MTADHAARLRVVLVALLDVQRRAYRLIDAARAAGLGRAKASAELLLAVAADAIVEICDDGASEALAATPTIDKQVNDHTRTPGPAGGPR